MRVRPSTAVLAIAVAAVGLATLAYVLSDAPGAPVGGDDGNAYAYEAATYPSFFPSGEYTTFHLHIYGRGADGKFTERVLVREVRELHVALRGGEADGLTVAILDAEAVPLGIVSGKVPRQDFEELYVRFVVDTDAGLLSDEDVRQEWRAPSVQVPREVKPYYAWPAGVRDDRWNHTSFELLLFEQHANGTMGDLVPILSLARLEAELHGGTGDGLRIEPYDLEVRERGTVAGRVARTDFERLLLRFDVSTPRGNLTDADVDQRPTGVVGAITPEDVDRAPSR